ncbi:DUF2264 domain-containing protein [Paenibacillus mucilaginosus]|uniref:DUF2264 domain-containing protein n=1 Tax=Paenibacillus mucilaginosus (strain KNP414) TaxID=1036673 RepID=F8FQ97_PAEMK|nr:DUF2264 domain-containing protein [Paenibacillus mucilaginosus]AEI40317.1 hypothetical protein KNP414_01755 [Paenibacillus mucilaginosus KNP414]MCG7213323.1 DUF2264 domain-containing protein [Paenibacillus mucilaginosus]WDM29523.1 DUF2264 domain-containing protein [Paenibacillus mucilaginosus]
MDQGELDRKRWIQWMLRIAEPVLSALNERSLKSRMPIQGKLDDRGEYTYLESLGRLLCGMAPWLELTALTGEEEELQRKMALIARNAIDAATDPSSPDFMNFSKGHQPIVDAAFLSHALLRAPVELIAKLDDRVKHNLIACLKATRTRKPCYNNWLLFAAMTETALYKLGADWDPMRVDFALKKHQEWYLGDGMYGDGDVFHWDYYNSFVIQPMLVDIVLTLGAEAPEWEELTEKVIQRAARHAVQQERLISPEGTFPAIGRSLAYRFGAFQLLSQAALKEWPLPGVASNQVRCALTAVIERMIEAPGTFDPDGWLRIGFCGDQPDMGEAYISTGSLYLCTSVFLPLGLPPEHSFWQGKAEWTSKKAWSGQPFPIDAALQ